MNGNTFAVTLEGKAYTYDLSLQNAERIRGIFRSSQHSTPLQSASQQPKARAERLLATSGHLKQPWCDHIAVGARRWARFVLPTYGRVRHNSKALLSTACRPCRAVANLRNIFRKIMADASFTELPAATHPPRKNTRFAARKIARSPVPSVCRKTLTSS
jgi:hypothetical protein